MSRAATLIHHVLIHRTDSDRVRFRKLASLLLAIMGLVVLLDGLWIPAKARLAQFLLHDAWQRSLAGEEHAKPWSWADTWPIARLRIPSTGDDFIVLAGTSGRSLAFGPGHLDGTPLPGAEGNSVIVAHRDTQFASLGHLSRGDEIVVERPDGEAVHYRIARQFITSATDTWVASNTGDTRLTLITCYPFDAITPGTPYRYVVVAERRK